MPVSISANTVLPADVEFPLIQSGVPPPEPVLIRIQTDEPTAETDRSSLVLLTKN